MVSNHYVIMLVTPDIIFIVIFPRITVEVVSDSAPSGGEAF